MSGVRLLRALLYVPMSVLARKARIEARRSPHMSTDKQLKKIEKALSKILEAQESLSARVRALEAPGETPEEPTEDESVMAFLDQFRAGEALGEAFFGAWIAVCEDDGLRGGLRTIQQREGMHARLLEERLKALGCTPEAEIPVATFDAAMAQASSTEKDDAEKLLAFTSQFPDADAALAPIAETIEKLRADHETRGLLETICQDERATLEWLGARCAERND